jgi:TetR/AcrR family transcriptional regulator
MVCGNELNTYFYIAVKHNRQTNLLRHKKIIMDEKELSLEMEAKILKAATVTFIRKGKAGASMQDIANEAGINRTLLNYYFRSKDKLFEKVFAKVFLQFIPAIIEKLNSGKSILNRLEDIIDYYFYILTENPAIPIFIIQEIATNPNRFVSNIKEKGLNPSVFLSTLKIEMDNGNLKQMDPRMLMVNLLSLIIFPFAARPIIEGLIFEGNKEEFALFIEERKEYLKINFIETIKP